MPSQEIFRIRNCIHITVLSCFLLQLVSKSVSRAFLGLKLVKLDCIFIHFGLDTIKKARNELDGARGLPLVKLSNWIKDVYEVVFKFILLEMI